MFPFFKLTDYDRQIASRYVDLGREPDLVIHSGGRDYLHRWYLTEHIDHSDHRALGQTYFHIQTGDDDDRGLHDHPWPSMSVILAGGYSEEFFRYNPRHHDWMREVGQDWDQTYAIQRKPGDVIFREANQAHRLTLPAGVKYTMTLFNTGPVVRDWGFYMPEGGWVSHEEAFREHQITPEGKPL